jgi:hypothetical protein
MTKNEKQAQINRISRKLWQTEANRGGSRATEHVETTASHMFRMISRITHAQVAGDQRRTKRSRAAIDEQIIANVGHAIRVLR